MTENETPVGPALVGFMLVVFGAWFAYIGALRMSVVCLGLLVVESLGVVVLE